MKATRSTRKRPRSRHFSGKTEITDFERILDWACLATACMRQDPTCGEKHRQILKAKGESDNRLREVAQWRRSLVFNAHEKAAFALSESITLIEGNSPSKEVLEEVRCYFGTEEMIRLTMTVAAVNDWISLHSDPLIRVLIVEDDPEDEELFRLQLRRADMERNVIFVRDGHRALELLTPPESEAFRRQLVAVFLDLHLPGLSGPELLRKMRAISGLKDIAVILMTSSNDPDALEACRRLGVASYMQKPITLKGFLHVVADIFPQTVAR